MDRRALAGLVALAGLASAFPTWGAAPPEVACIGKKIVIAASSVGRVFKCQASTCVPAVLERFDEKIAATDGKLGCTNTSGNAAAHFVIDGIRGSFGSTLGIGESECGERQWKATARRALADLKAHGNHVLKPDAAKRDAALAKNAARFASDYAKTLAYGDCVTTDPAAIESELDASVVQPLLMWWDSVCGNAVREAAEQCDGASESIPGCYGCTDACRCSECGNGVAEPGEACDGGDDGACPGACESDCGCPGPVVCGDGDVDAPETCDGTHIALCSGVILENPACTPSCGCCSLTTCHVGASCCPGLDCVDVHPVPGLLGYLGSCE